MPREKPPARPRTAAVTTPRPDDARQGPAGSSCLFIKFLFQTLKFNLLISGRAEPRLSERQGGVISLPSARRPPPRPGGATRQPNERRRPGTSGTRHRRGLVPQRKAGGPAAGALRPHKARPGGIIQWRFQPQNLTYEQISAVESDFFEYFCLAGKRGLAAPWRQECPGDPGEAAGAVGWGGTALPRLPLPPYTHHSPITSAPLGGTSLPALPTTCPARSSLSCATSF